MNLNELHKVMKGDMTVDQACDGMTDDFEIGHVSHRADGDYRKVAQGKWVPVKAGGQGQMGASEKPAAKARIVIKQGDKMKVLKESMVDHIKGNQDDYRGYSRAEFEDVLLNSSGYKTDHESSDKTGKYVSYINPKSGAKIKIKYDKNEEFDSLGAYNEAALGRPAEEDVVLNHEAEFADIVKQKIGGKPEEPKAEGGDNTELSISEETGRDKFMDKLTTFSEKYNDPSKVTVWKTEKGNWDTYYDGHRLGLIGGDQINDDLAKKLGWYQGDYATDAAPRLTRDTKIRLSRIKREQTQDKTYNVGETSQRKDGLYKKVAPGKWAPVKAGGSAGAPAGGKMSKEDLTKRVGELMKTDKNLQKVVKAAGGTIPGEGKAAAPKKEKVFPSKPTKVDVASIKEGGTFTGPNGGVVKIEKITDEGIKVTRTGGPEPGKTSFTITRPSAWGKDMTNEQYAANFLGTMGYKSGAGSGEAKSAPGQKPQGGSGAGQPFKPKAIRLGPNGVEAVSNIAFDIPTDWKAKFPEAARYVAEREEKGYATKLGDAIVKEIVTNGGGDPQKTAELLNNSKIGYTDWQPGLNTEAFFTIKTTDHAGNTRQLKIWK